MDLTGRDRTRPGGTITEPAVSTLGGMALRRRCPNCGATNLADAEWCGQCYQPLLADDAAVAAATGATGSAEAAGVDPAPAWRCRTCGEMNPLDADGCPICGMSMFDALAAPVSKAPPRVALLASLVPGLGLGRVGMPGEGIITALLVAFAVVGGAVIAAAGEPLAFLLIVGGAGLWAVSARDAFVVASSDRESAWLQARTLTILAVLILLLTAAALLRAIPSRGRS